MKHNRFLLSFCIVAASMLLYVARPPTAAGDEYAMKIGKNAEVTFSSETKVGDITLPPGRYRLQHRVEGSEHFIHFIALSRSNPYFRSGSTVIKGHPGEVKCRVEPLAKAVSQTAIFTEQESGVSRITRVEIPGENVAHLF